MEINMEDMTQGVDQAGKVSFQHDWSKLPRSVRWRLQLGILAEPPTNQQQNVDLSLDVIYQHNQVTVTSLGETFKQLVSKYVEESEEEDGNEEEKNNDGTPAQNGTNSGNGQNGHHGNDIVDPLTAMVMEEQARETRKAELYLKYRKERARRKRGLTTEARIIESESEEVDRASLVIIEKDLKRLPHPAEGGKDSNTNSGLVPTDVHEHDARITSLREVLYIYAQEHPEIGYRQGMHEIASYLMYVLELEHQQYPDHPLFHEILPVCYSLLDRVLNGLRTAYDASGGKSLQQMSVTILGKILQNDNPLYHHLTSNSNIPPPPIYCTRWVRLMFSREVVGYENVFKLWDVLFSYSNIMYAIEICCATRILLLRDALMADIHSTLDLLMNVPPLTDISQLTGTLERLMLQKDTDPPIPIPKSQQILPKPNVETSAPVMQQGMTGTTMSQSQSHLMTPSNATFPAPHQNHWMSNQTQNFTSTPVGGQNMVSQQSNVYQPSSTPSSYGLGDPTKFSFSKMRQSLGHTSDTLRKKIITTTNEWKQAATERQNSRGSFTTFDPFTSSGFSNEGPTSHSHIQSSPYPNHQQYPPTVDAAGTYSSQFPDPSLRQQLSWMGKPSSTTVTPKTADPSAPVSSMLKTPKQHLHDGWSNRLEEKIVTIQRFLEDLKSKEIEGFVPNEIWEALVELDQMKNELRNYSRSMNGSM